MQNVISSLLIVGGVLCLLGVVWVYDRHIATLRKAGEEREDWWATVYARDVARGWEDGYERGKAVGFAEGKKIGRIHDEKTGRFVRSS